MISGFCFMSSRLSDYLYQVGVDSSHGNGYDTLYLYHHTAVASALYFQEDTFLTLEITAGDADPRPFGQVHLFGLEVETLVAITACHSDEAAHVILRNDNLPTAAGIRDVLKISRLGLDTLQIRRTRTHKYQVVYHRNQNTHAPAFPDGYLMLHRDEALQTLLFEQAGGIGLPAVRGTHRMP